MDPSVYVVFGAPKNDGSLLVPVPGGSKDSTPIMPTLGAPEGPTLGAPEGPLKYMDRTYFGLHGAPGNRMERSRSKTSDRESDVLFHVCLAGGHR